LYKVRAYTQILSVAGNEMKFQLNNSQGKDKALYQRLEAEFKLEVSNEAKNFFECKLM